MKKLFKILLILFAAGTLLGAAGAVGLYVWASHDLPGFKKITDYRPPLVTTVHAADGQVLGYFYKERRFLARLDDMSPWLSKAFLAAEDSAFYQHDGVDLVAIFRAMVVNIKHGSVRQGGSTITQQVIKGLLLTSERKYERKIKEAILAYRLERYLTKSEILTIYLNHIYLGSGSYGVEAAARTYFGKHAKDLTIAECAVLAGLPQAPSRYSPLHNPTAARARQHYVLGEMRDLGWITRAQYDEAVAQKLEYKSMPDPSWSIGPYYLEEVRRWLVDRYGEDMVYNGGLQVWTGCDLKHQAAADEALRKGLIDSARRRGWTGPIENLAADARAQFLSEQGFKPEDLEQGKWIKVLVEKVSKERALVRFGEESGVIPVASVHWCRVPDIKKATEQVPSVKDVTEVLAPGDVVWASVVQAPVKAGKAWTLDLEREPDVEGALVSMKPDTGEVVAMCGGYDFNRSQFNRATQARRQPGSAFKPIVYSAAIDNGFTPASVIMDAPIVFSDDDEGKLWRPENYEGVFYGPTLLRTALVKSRNLVTIRIAQKIGIRKIIERAKALGLQADFPEDLSVSLGSASVSLINLCQAYSTFARGGSWIEPRMVLSVQDSWGEEIYRSQPVVKEAVSPQTAYIMASLMKDVVQYGTGFRAKALGRPVAGKTGTSNNEQDAWFMGYTPYLLTGVFVGFDQMKPMGRLETGSRAASPIWVDYRSKVENDYPYTDFQQPEGIVMARIDAGSGLLAGPSSQESYFLPFKVGSQPTETVQAASSPGAPGGTEDDLFKQVF